MKEKVYVIVGSTATGKTALGVALAQKVHGEVISADSMQIYREMDIGTAKPTKAEQCGIPHHMIDIINPDEVYSAALYQKQAQNCIADILSRGHCPIIVGGTGLYINALTYDLDFSNTVQNTSLRQELEQYTNDELYQKLQQSNSAAAERIHPNNRKRVIRALEIALSGSIKAPYDFLKLNDTYDFTMLGLSCNRQKLYQKIEKRVDCMMQLGLHDEAAYLYGKYSRDLNSMQAIGYKEWAGYFSGQDTVDNVITSIKQNTRRFAKRQITWFKRDARIKWYDIEFNNISAILSDIDKEREVQ